MRISKLLGSFVLIVVLGAGFAPQARAGDKEDLKERIKNLTPEQKEKLRERIKDRLKNLTPEQREKLKERMKDRRKDRRAK